MTIFERTTLEEAAKYALLSLDCGPICQNVITNQILK